ncbi:MAG: hypothetical protein DIU68_011060 [Chloroflexota bacterium]|nr:MAG: hypothetical protein DIU68_15910 [Chloroflexota bacterium]
MSRVINTDSSGKRRTQLMRTAAEILRRLSQKTEIDAEAKDMVAALVFIFREIEEGIETSAAAWEKRDYWMKAEELRQRWMWPGTFADQLQELVLSNDWASLPQMMVKLLPHFNDIKVTKMTRSEADWRGSHARLLAERPPAR